MIEALEDSPVVLIHGHRQSGKTELAKILLVPEQPKRRGSHVIEVSHPIAISHPIIPPAPQTPRYAAARAGGEMAGGVAQPTGYKYYSFDDAVTWGSAEADPMGFVAGLPDKVILDEVQRVPALFTALKMEADRNRVAGRFVLTGSSNVLRTPALGARRRHPPNRQSIRTACLS